MYSPRRPGGAISATYARAGGKRIISPNVHHDDRCAHREACVGPRQRPESRRSPDNAPSASARRCGQLSHRLIERHLDQQDDRRC
jgi:hypothetical protein